ncbi:hypothetical protein [Planomonospora algeriensis]
MTITPLAPDDDYPDDLDVILLPLPDGATIPRLADWAIPAAITDTPQSVNLAKLALACIAISEDLAAAPDGTPEEDLRRQRHLLDYHEALRAVTADIGPLRVAVTRDQALEFAETAHAEATGGARVIALDAAVIWDVLAAAGHGGHDGWTHDPRWPEIVCSCGEALRFTAPAAR